jgi:two-component system, NarL family, sensor histidine kinase YdfH
MVGDVKVQSYIWLYFFYGLAFFSLGISALQQKLRHSSEFPLMRWIHLLGLFGLFHGIAEWITMMRIMGVYQETDRFLYLVETLFHGISFAYLLSFGIALMVTDRIKHLNLNIWVPWMIFLLWIFFYLGRYYSVPVEPYGHIRLFGHVSRYLLGFPGAILSGLAYFVNGRQLRRMQLQTYARMYAGGGILFLVYAVTAGLVTPAMDNAALAARLPMEVLRAGSAIGITVLTIRLFDSFVWELQERLNEYAQQQMILQERKKTIRMVHDQIIQRLFGAGMHIENMLGNEPETYPEDLIRLKEELNQTIGEARTFLQSFSETSLVMEDFQDNLQNLIERFRLNSQAELDFEYHVPPMVLGKLSPEKSTQLYYIIQEALMNIQKHARANHVRVEVSSNLQELSIRILDDGVGIPLDAQPKAGFGLKSMKERAEKINAAITFERKQVYTCVTITVPWEERKK